MHEQIAEEYFELQLQELERDERYTVKRKSKLEAIVTIRAGMFLPVLRIKADNYDLEPPLIEFADPNTEEKLPEGKWPTGSGIASGNNLYPGPIICITGNRTYHTHSSHLTEQFHKFRNTFTIKRFIDRVAGYIQDGRMNMNATRGIYYD